MKILRSCRKLPEDVMTEFDTYYDGLMKKLIREAILYHKHRVDKEKQTK